MIYTVTFNPAIDYVIHTGKIDAGATNRALSEEYYIGGKGINVSTMLSKLGCDNVALGFVAGFTGAEIERVLHEEGIKTKFVHVEGGFSRINLKLKSEVETEINAKGPKISTLDLAKLLETLDEMKEGDYLVLSGNVPPSVPQDIYEQIMKMYSDRGVKFIVDAEGDLLLGTLAYKPFLLKPNLAELEGVTKRKLESDWEIANAAKELIDYGAQNVLVSLDGKGALMVTSSGQEIRVKAARGIVRNSSGAGDSMVAGFISAIESGKKIEDAVKFAVAAGTATAFTGGIADKKAVETTLRYM